MSILTSGRTEPVRNNIGGIRNIYLFSYDESANFSVNGQELVSFDTQTLFKYDVTNGSLNESITNDENGIFYLQTLTFRLFQQDVLTSNELETATNIDLRYIVEFNNGDLKISGLYNGSRITNIDTQSGGAKSDFNGYNVTIEGREELPSFWLGSLEIFDKPNLLLESMGNFLLQTGGKLLLQNG